MNLMKCELYFNKVFTKIERKLNPASGCEWIGADEGRTASSYRLVVIDYCLSSVLVKAMRKKMWEP